jgi:hypothetical protein
MSPKKKTKWNGEGASELTTSGGGTLKCLFCCGCLTQQKKENFLKRKKIERLICNKKKKTEKGGEIQRKALVEEHLFVRTPKRKKKGRHGCVRLYDWWCAAPAQHRWVRVLHAVGRADTFCGLEPFLPATVSPAGTRRSVGGAVPGAHYPRGRDERITVYHL